MRRRGEALRDLHRFAGSEAALLRALDLFVELARVDEEVEVRTALGTLYNNFRRHELSVPMMERARELLPAGARSPQAGWVRLVLGLAYRSAGRRVEADAVVAEVPAIATRAGDDYLLAYHHQELAWTAESDGRWDDAERGFTQMRALAERAGNGAAVGGALLASASSPNAATTSARPWRGTGRPPAATPASATASARARPACGSPPSSTPRAT